MPARHTFPRPAAPPARRRPVHRADRDGRAEPRGRGADPRRRHVRIGRGQHRVPRSVGHRGQPRDRAGGRLALRQQDDQSRIPTSTPPTTTTASSRRASCRTACRPCSAGTYAAMKAPILRRRGHLPDYQRRGPLGDRAHLQPGRAGAAGPRHADLYRKDPVLRLAAAEGLAGEDVDEAQGADASADSALPRHGPRRSSGHQHGNVRAGDAALIAAAPGKAAMNTETTFKHSVRQSLVALVSIGLALGPLADAARAQTPLADIPIASKVTAKPNIVYTLDDFGQHAVQLPARLGHRRRATTAVTKITRAGATATVQVASTAALSVGQWVIIAGANQPEYNGEFQIVSIPNGTTSRSPSSARRSRRHAGVHHVRGRHRLLPRRDDHGLQRRLAQHVQLAAVLRGELQSPDVRPERQLPAAGQVRRHAAHAHDRHGHRRRRQPDILANVQTGPVHLRRAAHVNLTAKVAVPLYCNTDWPHHQGRADEQPDDRRRRRRERRELAARGGSRRLVPDQRHGIQGLGRLQRTRRHVCERKLSVRLPVQELERRHRNAIFLPAAREQDPLLRQDLAVLAAGAGRDHRLHAGGHADLRRAAVHARHHQADVQPEHPGQDLQPHAALRNFTPAVCKTPSALYCLPSVGGSDGNSPGTGTAPECLPCTCNADFQPASTKKCSIVGQRVHVRVRHAGLRLGRVSRPVGDAGAERLQRGVPIYNYSPAGSTTCTAFLWDPVANNAVERRRRSCRTPTRRGMPAATTTRSTRSAALRRPAAPFTYPRTSLGDVYAANKTGSRRTRRRALHHADDERLPDYRHDDQHPAPLLHDRLGRSSATTSTPRSTAQWRGFGTGVCKPANDLTQYKNVQYGTVPPRRPRRTTAARLPVHRPGHAAAVDAHVRGGDHQLRELVRLLPPSRARREDHVRRSRSTCSTTRTASASTRSVRSRRRSAPTPRPTPPSGSTSTISTPGAGNQRNLWWNALFAVPTSPTSRRRRSSAMLRIGNLFETGGAGGLPGNVYPLPAGAKDPLKNAAGNVVSCQSNYHILFTDGFTNQIALPTVAGEQDNVTPASGRRQAALPDGVTPNPDNVLPDLPRAPRGRRRSSEGTKRRSDTLADVATVLLGARPAARGQGRRAVLVGQDAERRRPDEGRRVVAARAVLGALVRLGGHARRREPVSDHRRDQPPPAAQPALAESHDARTTRRCPRATRAPSAIDDLWHATVNGARHVRVRDLAARGRSTASARSSPAFRTSAKSRVGRRFLGPGAEHEQQHHLRGDDRAGLGRRPAEGADRFRSKIPPSPGARHAVGRRGGPRHHDQAGIRSATSPGWTSSKPRIVTWNGATRTAFRATAGRASSRRCPATQLATLAPTRGCTQQKMVAYLRGGTTYTTTAADARYPRKTLTIEGTRHRPVPQAPAATLGRHLQRATAGRVRPTSRLQRRRPIRGYAAFVAAQKAAATRTASSPRRNDGMVHVFDGERRPRGLRRTSRARCCAPRVDANGGKPDGHPGADVPGRRRADLQAPFLRGFLAAHGRRRLQQRRRQRRLRPDWHTIVVGGMGKGGNTYYAIDAHQPRRAPTRRRPRPSCCGSSTTAGLEVHVRPADHRQDLRRTAGSVIVTSGYNNVVRQRAASTSSTR